MNTRKKQDKKHEPATRIVRTRTIRRNRIDIHVDAHKRVAINGLVSPFIRLI